MVNEAQTPLTNLDESHASRAEEWRSIDTAPRDGTMIDLWHRTGDRAVNVWWEHGEWVERGFVAIETQDGYTHWTLPPDPPKE